MNNGIDVRRADVLANIPGTGMLGFATIGPNGQESHTGYSTDSCTLPANTPEVDAAVNIGTGNVDAIDCPFCRSQCAQALRTACEFYIPELAQKVAEGSLQIKTEISDEALFAALTERVEV